MEQRLGVAAISGRRHGRGGRPAHPCRRPPGDPGAERRRDAADGSVGPAELGGFHRAVGDRRQGRALLAAGGAQPAAQAGKPRPGGLQRRGLNGSPLSGGYAGAKRMLWFMAKYANGVSEQKGLGIRFQAIVPLQIIGGTGVGDAGVQRLRAGDGHRARGVPGPVRRADAAPPVR